ncbi:carbonic anhydrase [Bacillus carboniphilus]|uniref:Carbonic anhydrase n=1 Tax=Bacillus carboniphilus TaxID=86663 RepID=A0ABN0WV96_9BACI
MNLDKNQKALFVMDVDTNLDPILQELPNISPENILSIQCYGPVISSPYGDIMKSVIYAIYQENVEEIFVVVPKEKESPSGNSFSQLDSIQDHIQTLDYLFQNSNPEFQGGTVQDWLYLKGSGSENINKCVDMIQNHPLVPAQVKVRGLIVDFVDGDLLVVEVPLEKEEAKLNS